MGESKSTINIRLTNKKYIFASGKSSKGSIKNRVSIDKGPQIIDSQKYIGDFEGDTIVGKNHNGSLVTLVDRKSLF